MLEIDDRYPEFARPYEPIKGRRRHGRLTGNESAFMVQRRLRRLDMTRRGFLTGVGVLIMLTLLMPEAKEELILPHVEPAVIETNQPAPEPEVITETEDLPVVIPDPEPIPIKPKPEPKPEPRPDPKPEPGKTAPVINLDPYVRGPDPEGYSHPTLFFEMKLNDLKGGSAKGRIYVDTGSGFHEPDLNKEHDVVVTYDPTSVSGDVWSDSIWCLIQAPEGGGIKGEAKIVFDIVYPDGKTARIESETRPVHMGSYVRVNPDYGDEGYMLDEDTDPVTGDPRYIFRVDLLIDKTLVDPQKIKPDPDDELWHQDAWVFYNDYDLSRYTDSSGNYHITYNFYSDSPFTAGRYWFSAEPVYPEDDQGYNVWVPIDFYKIFDIM